MPPSWQYKGFQLNIYEDATLIYSIEHQRSPSRVIIQSADLELMAKPSPPNPALNH